MLEGVVDELLGSSDTALDERVRSLELERRRIDAEMAITVGEIGRRKSYLDDGHRSVKAYLRATCNYSDAEAARVDRLSAAIADLSGLAEALHDGRIGAPQANELATAYANRRVRERLIEFAPLLLDQAERLSFREFRTCVQRFVMLADLDGAHRDRDTSIANRHAGVTNLDGSLHLAGGGGDPLVNVELEAIFRHFCDLEFAADVAARKAEFGDLADQHPLPRTAAQRGYDAFVAIMRGALANDRAGRAPAKVDVCVNVLIDHRTWAQLLASAGLAPDQNLRGEQVDPFTGIGSPTDLLHELLAEPDTFATRRCESDNGVILDPHTVLRAALAGHIRRVVLGADDVAINMGRKARVFVGGARDAARLLAVQCDHPGCGVPAEWSQIDHCVDWTADGTTDQANGNVKCGTHNRLKYRQRWRTKRDVHGRLYTIRADGTIMLPVGARPPRFTTPGPEPDLDPHAATDAGPPDAPAPDAAATDAGVADGGAGRRSDCGPRLDEWAERGENDSERRCRGMRVAAIRHAVRHGDQIDVSVVIGRP